MAASALIGAWATLATAAALAAKAGLRVPALDARQTTLVAAALFVVACYLPIGLTGAQLALRPGMALRLWLALAPALTLAIALIACAGLARRYIVRRSSPRLSLAALGLQVVVAALIVLNCFWVVEFDAFMRD